MFSDHQVQCSESQITRQAVKNMSCPSRDRYTCHVHASDWNLVVRGLRKLVTWAAADPNSFLTKTVWALHSPPHGRTWQRWRQVSQIVRRCTISDRNVAPWLGWVKLTTYAKLLSQWLPQSLRGSVFCLNAWSNHERKKDKDEIFQIPVLVKHFRSVLVSARGSVGLHSKVQFDITMALHAQFRRQEGPNPECPQRHSAVESAVDLRFGPAATTTRAGN